MSIKKKLLFINMEYSQEEINEPINVDIIVNCLPKEFDINYDVETVYRDFGDKKSIKIDNYDIILISTKISSYNQLQHIIELCENKIVIIGGILSICAYDELAKMYPYVVFNTGEGETNIGDLIKLAYNSPNVELFKKMIIENNISNVFFYYEKNKNYYSSIRTVCDLKAQICPQHNKLKDVIQYNGLVRMETSRGCPWNKCEFCIMPWKFCGEKWRSFSESKIEKELDLLIKSGAKKIIFTDEDFIGNYNHIMSLCSIINETVSCENSISFGGSTSVYTLLMLGDKLDYCLQKMYDSGINFLFIGIESGCDSQLLRFNKGVTVSMNEKVIKKLKQYNFEIDYGFIMFDADTTMREVEENLCFLSRTGLVDAMSRFTKKLRVTPHTYLFEDYKARNLLTSNLIINELYYDYKFCDPIIEILYFYLNEIEIRTLSQAYQLQAKIRSSVSTSEKAEIKKQLILLRENTSQFLCKCVEVFKKNNALSKEDIIRLYNNSIINIGDE